MFTIIFYYLLVGIVIVAFTPARKQVLKATKHNKYESGQPLSLYKNLVLHTMVFTVGVLLWPVLLLKWFGMLTKQIEPDPSINAKSLKDEQHVVTSYATSERVVKAEKPATFLKGKTEPQSKQKEFFNVIKAIGIVVLIFFGVVALLSAISDKKHTGQPIEYLIVYTTINGQYYEKEATAQDLNNEFVTFSDGTRVPWTAVKTKKAKIYPDELGTNTNSNQ